MAISDNLKKVRKKAGLKQAEMAELLGLNLRTYGSYERGERDVGTSLLREICRKLNISSDELLENTVVPASDTPTLDLTRYNNIKPIQLKRIPLLRSIACGEPIFADEQKEHFVMADMDINADFCLRAKGDSMIGARIYDGDIVFIREMPIVDNGEIAAVIIGDEATLKRVYYDRPNNVLTLAAENPRFAPMVFRNEELDRIHILGKAVYFMSTL